MSEPTTGPAARCHRDTTYCSRCDLLVGLADLHVAAVDSEDDRLRVLVESGPATVGCRSCGVIAHSHGRRQVRLVDSACFGRPVELVWHKRTWRCMESLCPSGVFTEQDPQVAAPRALLTTRACWWAIGQIRREHASIAGLARQLGTTWNTIWSAIRPLLEAMADDQARFAGVTRLGVDEHVWHHVSERPVEHGGRGPKYLTGMVDLTPDPDGTPRARLLDLVAGRSGKTYRDWLDARGQAFRAGVKEATLDPFHGYKNAIDDQLQDAAAVLDAFHVVKLATTAVDECRRRVQQDIHGHRGRKTDPPYRIRNLLRAGQERRTERQQDRLGAAFDADERHLEVEVAWRCTQQLRSVYHQTSHAAGRRIALQILDSFTSCPIPEIARLGRTLRQGRREFLGYFDTAGANNGGAEAVNGLIELHRRIARGFRNLDNYRLRMLLIGGRLTHPHLR